PFFLILSPQYAGYDLETHYNQLSRYLDEAMGGGGGRGGGGALENGKEWRRTMEHPMNWRLMLPKRRKKNKGKKNLPPRQETNRQTRWLAPATNGGPKSLAPRRQCATPKQRGSRGGSKGCTQPPSASNPQPPSASNQVQTNHEGAR
ncbi:uncharacterized protein PGTG_19459, partial [Puccinia graminis f. sp. tritici CRL 75-36-700-3]